MSTSSTYQVEGMHCASCVSIIEKKLSKVDGVESIVVNLASETASIRLNKQLSLENLNQVIQPFGYQFLTKPPNVSRQTIPPAFIIALITFTFMIWEVLLEIQLNIPKIPGSMQMHGLLLFILASINLLFFGRQYILAIYRFIATGVANMDSLVGIGTLTAYLYSTFIFFFHNIAAKLGFTNQLYFDVTAVVIGFISFGKYLETKSKSKTGEAIKKLINLQAKSAIVIRGKIQQEIPVEEVKVGDHLMVKPGAKIPLDGIIIKGSTAIDESMITGEPIPSDKHPGDIVIGSTVNTYSTITIKVTEIGANTMLAQIIQMVANAQGSKAPIERLADKVSSIFVPLVLVIATITLIAWILLGYPISTAISSFVAVLVISCPCAMGLATPTGIIVGVGRGAENGILIKDAESLEKLHHIDVVVLDKTGTITIGKPEVVKILTQNYFSSNTVLQLAASLESLSEHPLAQAIVVKAQKHKLNLLPTDKFTNQPGKGIKGFIGKDEYYVGNSSLLTSLKIKPIPNSELVASGATPIFVVKNSQLIGEIYVSDKVRDNAAEVINSLKKMSIQVVMATGDNQQAAQYIAKQVGITSVKAQVLPADKAKIIQQYHSQGKQVAMVGDGINDAPALAIADVGIAMSTGSDIAIESANIALLHGDISKIKKAIKLSKSTMKIIKQNLFWAFVYNSIGIPLAASAILSPIFAGAAMALSSVSVVTNSLRLKKVKL